MLLHVARRVRLSKMPRWSMAVASLSMTLLLSPSVQAQSRTASLGIDTPEEYADFLDAIRASEYVRQDFILSDGPPRQIAVLAGLAAFADQNPLATQAQYEAFIAAYDAALADQIPSDPNLTRTGMLTTAIVGARVLSEGPLVGTAARVSDPSLELLGQSLGGLDGLLEARSRMTQFQRHTVTRLGYSTAFSEVLITNLLGVDGFGQPRPGLADATIAYLTGQGYAPMFGSIDPAQSEVNAGLANLPDFATFLAITSNANPTDSTDAIVADLQAVGDETQSILAAISTTPDAETLAQESAALQEAALLGDQAALDELAALEAELVARQKAVADERARVAANTLLLMQSEFVAVRNIAVAAQDFSAIQLETNNTLAVTQQSLGVAGSLVGVAVGIYTGDPWGAVQSGFELVSGAIGLGAELGILETPPSVDEQVFDQVVQMRQQVEEMRQELNARFDIVDQKLNTIYTDMLQGFDQLGNQIGILQETADEINQNIFEAREELSRLEESLFLLAETEFEDFLNLDAERALDYRNDTGLALPYSMSNTNFVDAAAGFVSFATFTSENPPYIDPTVMLTLDNADELFGTGVLGRSFGALNTVPAGLTLADGTPFTPGPFVLSSIPGVAAWSQPAAIYAQLARENPWSFAYQYSSQQMAAPGQSDLDRIIANGEVIQSFARNARNPELFEALIENARKAADQTQVAIDTVVEQSTIAAYGVNANGDGIDPWGGLKQGDFSASLPKLGPITDPNLNVYTVPSSVSRNGYGIIAGDNLDVTVDVADRSELIDRVTMARVLDSQFGDNFFTAVSLTGGNSSIFTIEIITALDRLNDTRWVVKRTLRMQTRAQSTGQPVTVSNSQVRVIINDLLSNDSFYADLDDGQLSSAYGTSVFIPFTFLNVVPYSSNGSNPDITFAGNVDPGDTGQDIDNDILPVLESLKNDAAVAVSNAVASQSSPEIEAAVEKLHDAEALLDAYATLALDDALNRSEVLRSALRGFSSVGFRRENLLQILNDVEVQGGYTNANDDVVDIPSIGLELDYRLDILQQELDFAIADDAPTFPYIEYVLAELERLGAEAFELATDDQYVIDGLVSVAAAEGLLANDVLQPGRTVEVDLDFLLSPEAVQPANGSVSINTDGSFDYTPDPGFAGTDRFTYRLTTLVDESGSPAGDPNAYSQPADVVLRVLAAACLADTNGDGFLDTGDITTFVQLFLASDLAADFNGDGFLDTGDITSFVDAFLEGC